MTLFDALAFRIPIELKRKVFLGEYECFGKGGSHRELWEQLLATEPDSDWPWVVGGDLNVIGSDWERVGGSQRRTCISYRFNKFMTESGLVDMGFVGPKFT
ncbi:hypothetical protein V6N11_007818 [Hibiscus sabdariffa]|uniref:Endonuclease/exonuclease/phosphatase domain-containing protein n=1 Tax=Hibiscus sabdariffa TaxID=183260 RepID=A0ABR2NK20_9ROSI